ncbi:hypothetical protein ACP70R_005611 [Stipagrostis hirtigluma subsp. patula]
MDTHLPPASTPGHRLALAPSVLRLPLPLPLRATQALAVPVAAAASPDAPAAGAVPGKPTVLVAALPASLPACRPSPSWSPRRWTASPPASSFLGPAAARGAADPPSPPRRRAELRELLARDAPLFLERYGAALSAGELAAFDALSPDYEVDWHLGRFQDPLGRAMERPRERWSGRRGAAGREARRAERQRRVRSRREKEEGREQFRPDGHYRGVSMFSWSF